MRHQSDRLVPSTHPVRAARAMGFVCAALALLLAADVGRPAQADPADANWSSDFGAPGLTGILAGGAPFRASVNWNGVLVVGGAISHAGGLPVQNVASWNGTAFAPLGNGLNDVVTSLAVVGATLYAAGDFTASGATPLPHVARWTGSAWVAVGSGGPDDPTELTLAVDGTNLLLLGQFAAVGSPPVTAQCIASWNGSAWSSVGGFAPPGLGLARAAARVGSRLYVGGQLDDGSPSYLNSWDGSAWSYDVAGLDDQVRQLTAVGGDLYVQGDFHTANHGGAPVSYVGRWNGTTFSELTNDTPGVTKMGIDGGQLFVVGTFLNHPGPYCSSWDGSNWTAGPARIWARNAPTLTTFTRIGGELFLCGNVNGYYDYTDGGVLKGAGGVVAWDGTRFRALGPGFGIPDDRRIYALTTYGGQLVAGGDFSLIGRLGDARGVATWDGTQWNRLGTGLNPIPAGPECDNLATWNGRLVITGYFNGAGAVASQHIIAWNGTGWEGFNGGFAGQGARVVEYDTQLIAAGLLQTEVGSGAALGHVARWTGTQWQTIGTVAPASGASATRSIVWNGQLVSAGLFSSINGVAAANIARWNGTIWSAFGSGLNGLITSLAVHNGELYASGLFTASGATSLPGYIARWNGSAWVAVGTGLDYYAEAMTSAGGELYVTGAIATAGGNPAKKVAAWDGTTWHALGSGLGQGAGGNNQSGLCLATHNGGLFVGGNFNTAGVNASKGIARWQLGAVTGVAVPSLPVGGLRLAPPTQNPAPGFARLALSLPEAGWVEAFVFDARGRLVRALPGRFLDAGEHNVAWDGRDAAGSPTPAGIYWVRVVTGAGIASQKVVLVR